MDCHRFYIPVSDIASRQQLRSVHRCLLTVPRHQRSTLGRRAFSVAGPTVWNLLPDQLRDSDCTESTVTDNILLQLILACCSALDVFTIMRYINNKSTFYLLTYLLTYLLSAKLKPMTPLCDVKRFAQVTISVLINVVYETMLLQKSYR